MFRLFALSAVLALLAGCQSLFSSSPVLVGTVWVVSELHGEPFPRADATPGNAAQGGGRPFFLQLQEDGHFRGYAGCNNLTGDYQLKGSTLRVGPFASTRMFCAPDVMKLERAVVMAMEGSSSYVIEDGTLILRNPIGIAPVKFRPLQGAAP